MSSYTMMLSEYIDMVADGKTLSTKDKIELGRTKLFDFDYPIFNENYKKDFETHFIRRFYMREIGAETEGLFKFNLETWLLINMPYFNKLFESELIDFDPLTNAHMTSEYTKVNDRDETTTGTSSNTVNATNTTNANGTQTDDKFNRNLHSDNPDSRLQLTANDGEGVIEYASDIDENNENNVTTSNANTTQNNDSTSDFTGSSNGSTKSNETYNQSRTGKIGIQSYSKMLNEYRDSFVRIENMIFKEMQDLFMLVY